MKKLLFILVIAAGGYISTGYQVFSGEKMLQFLNRLDDYAHKDSDQLCAQLDDALTFSLVDTSTQPTLRKSGGKQELCRFLAMQEVMYRTAPIADRHFFANLRVDRNWKHWGQATLHYETHHEIEFFPMRKVIRSMSQEDMSIVKEGDNFRITRWDIAISLE